MKTELKRLKLITVLLASRPKFLTASAAPVLVGSALGYAAAGTFSPILFILALLAIMALHAGANMANDYFDHLSGNDWANQNPTPFSGGSRYIQQGILSPKSVLLASLLALTVASLLGLFIVLITESLLILALGIAGLLGAFFYTAPPVRLGYRGIGEVVITFLFGLLPVYGSYYLQTRMLDELPLLPACIVGILVFLVILVNEFADVKADAAVSKKTLIVCCGVTSGIWIYRIALGASYIVAVAAVFTNKLTFFAGLFYLCTLPLAVLAAKSANMKGVTTPGRYRASQVTILLHALGCLALTAGFVLSGFFNRPIVP
ncbi:MAG: 1,4-dihydroxy-2-naphthoate octaprenyltransferase [Planctomycetota bacterium]